MCLFGFEIFFGEKVIKGLLETNLQKKNKLQTLLRLGMCCILYKNKTYGKTLFSMVEHPAMKQFNQSMTKKVTLP